MQQLAPQIQDELPGLLRRIAKIRSTCSKPCLMRYPDELKRDITRWMKHSQHNVNEAGRKLGIPPITLRSWSEATPALRVVEVGSRHPQFESERGSPESPAVTQAEPVHVINTADSGIIEVALGSRACIRLPLSALTPDLLQTFANVR